MQLHQQKGMISLSPPTICNSALSAMPLLSGLRTAVVQGSSPSNRANAGTVGNCLPKRFSTAPSMTSCTVSLS
ncbi:hypothetical protein ASV17_21910 [Enterobacter hormaechei subsp. xiangfangensis]|nr:hypothetical protein ASV17_21910 [Enterobacter hormaechei subsp. xiangfangensis]